MVDKRLKNFEWYDIRIDHFRALTIILSPPKDQTAQRAVTGEGTEVNVKEVDCRLIAEDLRICDEQRAQTCK